MKLPSCLVVNNYQHKCIENVKPFLISLSRCMLQKKKIYRYFKKKYIDVIVQVKPTMNEFKFIDPHLKNVSLFNVFGRVFAKRNIFFKETQAPENLRH